MAEHPDVERFRRALAVRNEAAPSADDVALLESLLADDVVWHGAPKESGGDATGRTEVMALWNAFAKSGGGAPGVEAEEVYADGAHAVALVEISADGSGKVRQAILAHMNPDRKITELWGLPSDRAIADAAGRGEPVPEHRNVAPFLAAEEARQRSEFGPEDMALIERFLADQVIWHMGGASEWTRQAQPSHREEVIQKFKMFKQATGGTLFFDIHHVFADDTHAASFVELTADRPDRPDKHMDVKEVNVFHLDGDGRAYEFWGIPTDEEERDRFWAND